MEKHKQLEDEDARVRQLSTPGFWEDDLAQINALSHQRRRYNVPYLRRQALYLGTKTLSASLGPHRQTRRRGLYKDQELAVELQPLLAAPVQFCERHGYSVLSLPTSVAGLTKAMGGKDFHTGAATTEHFLDPFRQRDTTIISMAKGDEAKGQYWIEDLEQIEALANQQGRDYPAFLRKVAFRIGVFLLTASGPDQGPFGLYETAEQVAGELCPLLAPAVLFLESQGYTAFPVPTVVTTLLDLIVKVLDGANHIQVGQKGRELLAPTETNGGTGDEEIPTQESAKVIKGRAVLSKEKRRRMNLDQDGNL